MPDINMNKLVKLTGAEGAAHGVSTIDFDFLERDFFGNFLSNVYSEIWRNPALVYERNWRPQSIWEDDDGYNLEIEFPGFNKSDVKVEYKSRAIQVSAYKNNKEVFKQHYNFPNGDYSKGEGRLENGMLYIKVPKTEEAKSREIVLK